MPWLFGRRSGKAAKLKEGRPAAAAQEQATAPARATESLRRRPSQRSARRRRGSSRSTASMQITETALSAANPFATVSDAHPPPHPRPGTSVENITALPEQRRLEHSPHLRPILQEHGGIPYPPNAHHSHASLPPPPPARTRGKLQRPQSLRRDPPTDSALVRRISSRRRKDHDPVREEQIRAMSIPMPQKRPAGHSGAMQRRDSKKVKGGPNQRFDRPSSHVSLPFEDSIHSSMSGISETRAFRVSTLDMFSPRPTIRYSLGSQYHAAGRSSPNTGGEKNDSRRERRPLSSREDVQTKRSSRIDDLADTLDAGALREIMERDKRRREKKLKADHERLRRRLERRAEKQRAAEVGGTPGTPRKEAIGAVGLGIEEDLSTPMDDVRPSTPPQQPRWLETLPVTPRSPGNNQLPTPLESPVDEPVVSDARAVRYSRGSVSAQVHARGPSNVSELPDLISDRPAHEDPFASAEQIHDPTRSGSLHPVETADTNLISQGGSSRRRSSEGKRMGVFASLFRRGKRGSQDRGRITPSEVSFSNTSRESMSRQPLPAHLVGTMPGTPPITIRRPSSVPRRTMSKFREDLPEFPLSPPDSRVQSPEVSSVGPLAARRSHQAPSDLRVQSVSSQSGLRSDSPVSPGLPVGNAMSQSLASVDSEGSWLSGRPLKRASNKSQVHSSMTSSGLQRNDDFNGSYEELGMADDEYFKKLSPVSDEHSRYAHSNDILGRKASSTLMALDVAAESEEETEPAAVVAEDEDEEEEEAKIASETAEVVKSSIGRQPTIVHRQARVKSAEGLLSMFADAPTPSQDPFRDDGANGAAESPDSPASDGEPMLLQRAKSIDLGRQHVRHLSAGSARLLDIQKR
ncbi:hypothetical protein IAQ61_003565 [Plenodomus lingam]|uniref:Uncharacterized protein n=1 Tax=Leptosphaeria maculans (strain JN3 / isolate v23.1.3 / race Av1-4-5-6-7-8) TaxID=985895 RepID=E4ZR07_LEPMJ|nr:hypothetical protein LEMA_P033460.1 [Plenodomus lingam JN3]KAH9874376.1 hypothetical protein IAQ61_003565 [Plenodomus lingam]CBX93672.1 hypothetical protein LEMA_P033460.1 [Plenodomus lingam JN3]